jgi:hypothetical protein
MAAIGAIAGLLGAIVGEATSVGAGEVRGGGVGV